MLADSCVPLSTVAVIGFKITATTATTATAPPVFRALGRAGWGCGIMSPLPGFRRPIATGIPWHPQPRRDGITRNRARALSSSACRTLALKGWNSSALRLGWVPVSRPSAPSPLGEPCNRVYSGVFLSSFRSSLVAAGAGHYSLLRLQMKPPGTSSMGPWNHDAKVRPFPRLRKFSGHFFSWISN